jgi:hypothetical protein
MNANLVVVDNWSNPESEERYLNNWPGEPAVAERREAGEECRACSFYAPIDDEWGLCLNGQSRHQLETVFLRFTCPSYVDEGVGPHSFSENSAVHCRCGGHGTKYLDRFSTIVESIEAEEEPEVEDDEPEEKVIDLTPSAPSE